MANRFGRNQKRKLTEMMREAERSAISAQNVADRAKAKLDEVLRDQLLKGRIPLEVEHFISPERRNLVMRAIFDERRSNLHYQHEVSPNDLRIERDRQERERFGMYLGRAIADRIADAYAGQKEGTSRG